MYPTVEYYSALKKEACIPASIKLESIILNKKPATKGHILYDSIYKKASRIGKLLETKSRFVISGAWNGSGCLMVLVFLFGVMEKFWNTVVVVVAQYCECT